ncbi:MAG TPA: class I SAM-dependent methyltransferase [Verrucomicrobiae bacterium]|nr:class I SAM-dependent methyltransferase [Verrucomicrobiae bacterium]
MLVHIPPAGYHLPVRIDAAGAIGWDVANWSAALRFWEREADLAGPGLDCLEIGAHSGGLSVWLAQMGHNVHCSDLENARGQAQALVDRYGVGDLVRYEDIDATAIPYDQAFDVIVFKSVLGGVGHGGAMDRQDLAIRSMHRALRPGGRLLFAENLTGSPMHRWLRGRYVEWGARWRYVSIDEMLGFLRPFSRVQYGTTGFLGALGRSERQRRAFSVVDRLLLNAIVPKSWRYIMYGVATK